MRRVLAVLNARSGVLLDSDPVEVRQEVEQALRGQGVAVQVVLARGRGILQAIDDAPGRCDTLVVGGGDGSVSYAAHRLAGTPTLLGVLPLGTLNLLARDLGMPTDLPGALAALAGARPRAIDLGSINGRAFHSISGLGFFTQMARAREETRDLPTRLLRLGVAALRAFTRTGPLTLQVRVDGQARVIRSFALLVTCNAFGGANWRRAALDAGTLQVHVAEDEGALARLKAGADFISGAWHENAGIHSYTGRAIVVTSLRRRLWAATDGELCREHAPIRYELRPRALNVLAP